MRVNWEHLAQELGLLHEDRESGGKEHGQRAIAELLGEDLLREAVDYYVEGLAGRNLARSVIYLLRPRGCVDRCLEIYQTATTIDRRRSAIELLRGIASPDVLPWVTQFLEDPDPDIQTWGMAVIDQLVAGEAVGIEDIEPLLRAGESHFNDGVRRYTQLIRDGLSDARR